jgi:hypothetical protein
VEGFDPELARTLLGTVQSFDSVLLSLLERLKVTQVAFDQAKAQAKPHPIAITDIQGHLSCGAKGCPACAGSGIAHVGGTTFFRTTPAPALSQQQAIAMLREQAAAQARAQQLLKTLADLFGAVAVRLETTRAHAVELAAILRRLSA